MAQTIQIHIVMEKNYASLLSLICEIKLDYRRINDVTIANGVLSIAFYDVKDASGKVDTRLCLKDSKSNEFSLSIKQLAGLRIEVGTLTSTWLDEFRNDNAGSTFQQIAREYVAQGKALDSIHFTVSKQLKVKNNQVTSSVQPVYKDFCYEGAAEYVRGVRALLNGKDSAFFQSPDYSRGMADLRDRLHASPLKPGKGTETDLVLLPVFKLS